MLLTLSLAAASLSFTPASSAIQGSISTPSPQIRVSLQQGARRGGARVGAIRSGASRVGARDRRSDEIGEAVRLTTRDKLSLAASYFAPRTRGDSKVPGVLLVHDAGSSRESVASLALYLQRKGYGVLTLDLRGHGESAGKELDWSKLDEKGRQSAWAFAARDLDAAASYLLKRKEVHAANLSIVGVGAGGALALRHAMDDDATRAVVLIDPPAEVYGFDMTEGIADLGGLPTLVVASKDCRDRAQGMQADAQEANDGYEYITVQVMRCDRGEVLSDKRFNSAFSKWLTGVVMDKDDRP